MWGRSTYYLTSKTLRFSLTSETAPGKPEVCRRLCTCLKAGYFSMVRPIIEYCSTVWSPHTKEYVIHGLVDMQAEDYLVPASTRTRSQHSLKFLQIPVSSDYYKFSFFRWNSLPAHVAEAPSLVSFKRELLSLSI